jgi:hypothetical protein
MDDSPDGSQLQQAGYDENNSDNRSWFHKHISLKRLLLTRLQRYGVLFIPPNFWDKQHGNVTNGRNVKNGLVVFGKNATFAF